MYNKEYVNTYIYIYHILYLQIHGILDNNEHTKYIHICILHTFISPVKLLFVLGPYTDLPAEIRELAHFHEACSPLQERHSVIKLKHSRCSPQIFDVPINISTTAITSSKLQVRCDLRGPLVHQLFEFEIKPRSVGACAHSPFSLLPHHDLDWT